MKKKLTICILCMLCFLSMNVHATQDTIAVTKTQGAETVEEQQILNTVENAKNAVVQVVLEYIDESGNKYLLKSGSGFLISDTVILTSYNNITLTEEEKERATSFVSEQVGKEVKFSSNEGGQTATTIGIAIYRDVVFAATLNQYSSKEMDLAILNVQEPINREKIAFTTQSDAKKGDEVYGIGYKEISTMLTNVELLSEDDCKIEQGIVNGATRKSQIKYLEHNCPINQGNSGGILVNTDGNVAGMLVKIEDDQEKCYALSSKEIIGLLDSCDIAYQEEGLFSNKFLEQEIVETIAEENVVDTSMLDSYLVNYSMLERTNYTEESYQALLAVMYEARNLKDDKNATQEEINSMITNLEMSKNALVIKNEVDVMVIILLVVLIVVVIGIIVVIVLFIRGNRSERRDTNSIQTLNQLSNQSRENIARQSDKLDQFVSNPRARSGVIVPPKSKQGFVGEEGTTVLSNELMEEEGTTVLNANNASERLNPYLTRVSNSEKIYIDRPKFVLGKGKNSTQYCIADNSTISREHAQIEKNGNDHYIIDLNSTNATYVNGRMIKQPQSQILEDGDVIRLSDEEFIFNK